MKKWSEQQREDFIKSVLSEINNKATGKEG